MRPSKADAAEIIHHGIKRAQRIADLESQLEHEREMRAVDGRWLVRNTTCTRTQICAALGISRPTLDKYLADGGMDAEYLAQVRAVQKDKGIELYSQDDLPAEFIIPESQWEKATSTEVE
jgi:hypothetical protein